MPRDYPSRQSDSGAPDGFLLYPGAWRAHTGAPWLSQGSAARANNFLPTLLIGNLDLAEMSDLLGERIIDRYREGGKVLVFDWESHRGKK